MELVRISIRRPLTTLMIIAILVIIGLRSYSLLQIDSFPDIDLPVVSVVIPFPDASPTDVEDLIVEPVEEAVATISGVDEITSRASEGVAVVTITFQSDVDADQAAIDVERQISAIGAQLPAEAEEPSVIKADPNAVPIMELVLIGPQDPSVLFEFADEELSNRFQSASGVASVSVSGGRDRQIEVQVDPTQLGAYEVSLQQVEQAIRNSDQSFPVGTIEQGQQKSTIRSISEFDDLDEIGNVVVEETDAGRIYVRNLAAVVEGLADRERLTRYNGRSAIRIGITKTSDANTVEVASNIYEVLDEIESELPAGAELIVFNDNSQTIEASVNGVQQDLILAILITGLVLLLFLHAVSTTAIVLFAIPTSIIITLTVMYGLGFTLNQVTLLALTLIIGNLVDDSIVVVENTKRHLEMGEDSTTAAIEGRREILLATLVIALTDVVVYLPVAFLSGIAGQIFFPYGVTIATATLASLFVGFTLTPMLASRWMKPDDAPPAQVSGLLKLLRRLFRQPARGYRWFTRKWDAGFEKLSNVYGNVVGWALANAITQAIVILIGLAALAGGFYLLIGNFVGTEFFPQVDDGQFSIELELPPGTSLDATNQVARQVERFILDETPETTAILTTVGSQTSNNIGGAGTASSNVATVGIRLVDQLERERSLTEIIEAIRPALDRLPSAIISINRGAAGGPGGAPIVVEVSGSNPNRLIDLANQVEEVMETVPGVVDLVNTDAARAPETEIVVDRDLAIEQDLYPAEVARTLRTAISGETIGEFDTAADTEIDITLRLSEAARSDLDRILQTPVGFTAGQPVRLGQVAEIQETLSPAVINRTDRQRVLSIEAGVEGRPAGDVTDDVEAAIQEQVNFPVGYNFQFAGQAESQREVFAQFGQAIALAVILVYVLMVALYQSWLQPLAIMASLPVAVVGSFTLLWLTGNTLNLLSILGVILLIGIATKNAILLVDFANQARTEGKSRKDALIEAGRTRLRPILMTSVTLIFALMPLLFAQGVGAANRRPLAAVVIGGAVSGVVLTLILIPVVYNLFDAAGDRVGRFAGRAIGFRPGQENKSEPSTQTG